MTEGYLFGLGAVLLFWVFSFVVTGGKLAPWALAVSESTVGGQSQGVVSASKFQALLWTLTTLFAYASVFGARLLEAPDVSTPSIPINLLVLMGLSAATAVGAKGVAVSYKAQGLVSERSGGLTTTPSGDADLTKTQLLVWTFIAAAIYLLTVVRFMATKSYLAAGVTLPDVDGTLLVLMGASQGTYIGGKLVSRDVLAKPDLKSLLPLKGPAGTALTLLGDSLGDTQGTNFVLLDDRTVRSAADGLVSWADGQIRITIPATVRTGDRIAVGVYRDGETSSRLFFEVT